MSAATAPVDDLRPRPADALAAFAQRNGWVIGLVGFLALLLVFTKLIQPSYGVAGVQGLAISVLPLALAAVGQAIVVISGGIDLSIGSMMALTSVVAAALMKGQPEEFGVAVVLGVLLLGLVLGAINGGVVVLTRVPDIVVTLAMSFVWAGCALLVLKTPGGGVGEVAQGPGHRVPRSTSGSRRALVVLIVVVALIWIPLRRSRLGLSLYAIGSNRLAAFRSGVPVGRTKRRRLHADGPVRGPRRPGADREHRDRDAGARALHAAERRGHRPRRREPRRRPRRRVRADRRGRDPPADPDRHDVPRRQHQPLGRPPGRSS